MKKFSKNLLVFGALLWAVAMIVFFIFALMPKKKQVVTYRQEAVTRGDVRSRVVTSGTLSAITLVDVGSQVSGKVEKLYVDFNDKVKKGDLLAELNQESFKMKIQQEEANYRSSEASAKKAEMNVENAKNKYDRAKALDEKKLISVEELETAYMEYKNAQADYTSAQARLSQAEAQLNSAKVDLSYTKINSPIDGIVINRAVNIGQTVAASYQAPILFQIANDLSKMQVQCNVDEADIGKVVQDQSVEFTVEAFPSQPFNGKVIQKRFLSQNLQNVITYPVIIYVDNPDVKLMPGMTATVSIIISEAKNVLLVPSAALRFTPQESPSTKTEPAAKAASPTQKTGAKSGRPQQSDIGTLWKLDAQGKLTAVTVRIGISDNTKTEIKVVISGELKEGDSVIIGLNTAQQQTPGLQQGVRSIIPPINR